MMDFSADGPGLAMITQKSIHLAKKERRGIEESGADSTSWQHYPDSPRAKKSNGEC